MSRDLKQDALDAKNRGNACLGDKDFDGAIDNYSLVCICSFILLEFREMAVHVYVCMYIEVMYARHCPCVCVNMCVVCAYVVCEERVQ